MIKRVNFKDFDDDKWEDLQETYTVFTGVTEHDGYFELHCVHCADVIARIPPAANFDFSLVEQIIAHHMVEHHNKMDGEPVFATE